MCSGRVVKYNTLPLYINIPKYSAGRGVIVVAMGNPCPDLKALHFRRDLENHALRGNTGPCKPEKAPEAITPLPEDFESLSFYHQSLTSAHRHFHSFYITLIER